eukprot:gene27078-33312_t
MHMEPAPQVLAATTVGNVQRVTHCNVGPQTRTQRVIEARRSAKLAATQADLGPRVCGADPQPQAARDIGLLAQRLALGAGSLAQALAWVRARCPSAGARPLAQLLAPDTEPRAQLLVQAQQKYGAEPQVQCVVTAEGGARPAVASQSMELQVPTRDDVQPAATQHCDVELQAPTCFVVTDVHPAVTQRSVESQRNSQPMAVQWGTQLEAFAEELAAAAMQSVTTTSAMHNRQQSGV